MNERGDCIAGIATAVRRTALREAAPSRHHGGGGLGSPGVLEYEAHYANIWYRGVLGGGLGEVFLGGLKKANPKMTKVAVWQLIN